MIDINELRRLAQAATSGEWYVERGNHIYGRNEVTDGEEVWHPVIACTDDDEVNVNFEANAAFIAAANPAAVSEIIERLEAAEKERDELRAKVAGLVPTGLLHVGGYYGEELQDWEFEADQQACDRLNEAHFQREATLNLYTLPGVKGEEK